MLAFDHSSFYAIGTRSAALAARRFLSTLGPADRVGLVSYPQPGFFVAPTTDRAVVERDLGRVIGTAARSNPNGQPFVSIGEAAAIYDGDRLMLDRVRERECAGLNPALVQSCLDQVRMISRDLVTEAQERTAQSLQGLADVLDRLRAFPGRKTMVLVSGGLVTSLTRSGESSSPLLERVASRAAAANVAIYVLHIGTGFFDAIDVDRRQLSDTIAADVGLQSAGLSDIAASTGGDLTTVTATADFAFDRITRMTSAAYVLGVETEPAARNGRPHAIGVKVLRPGVRVLSRQQFRIEPVKATANSSSRAPATPADAIGEALRTGRELKDLPLRVAVFRMKDIESGRVRALVRADIGAGVSEPADLTVGLAFVDASGRASQPDIRVHHLSPASAAAVQLEGHPVPVARVVNQRTVLLSQVRIPVRQQALGCWYVPVAV